MTFVLSNPLFFLVSLVLILLFRRRIKTSNPVISSVVNAAQSTIGLAVPLLGLGFRLGDANNPFNY